MRCRLTWSGQQGETRRRLRVVVAVCVVSVLAWCCALRASWGQESPGYQAALVVQDAIVEAIARAERSVVAIARVRKQGPEARIPALEPDGIPLNRAPLGFADTNPTSPDFVPNEFGTGVVIDREGHIVTNYHLLGNPAENDYYVWVQRRPFRVTRVEVPQAVRAGDPWTDLAVLQVSADNLEPIQLGDASALRKGMLVIALGNPYAVARDGEVSASWGIVSNLRRAAPTGDQRAQGGSEVESLHQYGTLIETDARLNLGTSGGALVNLKGEMIGLTTSLAALSGYEQAAGFAIPVDEAFRRTIETLKQGRLPSFGFLGVQPEHLSLDERQQGKFGVQVLRVVPGTPADRAGIREEDIITHVNGEIVYDKSTLFCELSKLSPGMHAALTVERRDALLSRRHTIMADVVVSKKFVPTARKPFAQVQDPVWRGLRVEYPSALPPQLSSAGSMAVDREGCVAVLDVERDSPAWKAGLQRGEYISHVGTLRVDSPEAFYAAVAQETGTVRLQLASLSGDAAIKIVPEGP